MPQGRVCGLPGSGTAGNEKGAPAVQKRGGVQHIKLLLLSQDEKSEAKCVKQVFDVHIIRIRHVVKDGARAVFFYMHFADAPRRCKKETIRTSAVADGKFLRVNKHGAVRNGSRFPGQNKNLLVEVFLFAGKSGEEAVV